MLDATTGKKFISNQERERKMDEYPRRSLSRISIV